MKAFILTCVLIASWAASTTAGGQELNSRSPLSDTQADADRDRKGVQSVIDRAERHYKLGELSLKDRNYDAARGEFDKAVDSVLESGIDVRSNPKLQTFYLQLIERIHRMEVPAGKTPRAATGARALPPGARLVTAEATTGAAPPQQPGINRQQKFEPSPLDELSRLEIGGEEPGAPESLGRSDEMCRAVVLRGVSLRGFTLGMSEAEVRRRLPRLRVTAGRYGLSSGTVLFGGRAAGPPPELKGVAGVAFTFMEGRVARILVGYDDSIRWDSLDEFVGRTAEALRLPKAWPAYRRADNAPSRGLVCDDVSLVTHFANPYATHKGPILTLEDRAAFEVFAQHVSAAEEQRRRAEERKKRTFKP